MVHSTVTQRFVQVPVQFQYAYINTLNAQQKLNGKILQYNKQQIFLHDKLKVVFEQYFFMLILLPVLSRTAVDKQKVTQQINS